MIWKDFYPTPTSLIRKMTSGLSLNGQYKVLEPSAGKGDIVDYIKGINRSLSVEAIEFNPELVNTLIGKGYNVVGSDFLAHETNTEYDYIIMNPPFSNGDDHLLKAIELASKQVYKSATIMCLLNAETLLNPYSIKRKELLDKVNKYGTYEVLKGEFKQALRTTSVDVALVKLNVDITKDFAEFDFKDYDKVEEETGLSTFVRKQDLAEREEEITLLVRLYNEHIKVIKDRYRNERELLSLESFISKETGERFYTLPINKKSIDEVIQQTRNKYWRRILRLQDFKSFMTNEAQQDLERQIENMGDLEITVDNIKNLIYSLYANRLAMYEGSILTIFDKITSHSQTSYSGNTHLYNGWKTNKAYKIGKRSIIPFYDRTFNGNPLHRFNGWNGEIKGFGNPVNEFIQDLTKSITLLTGKEYDETLTHQGDGLYVGELFTVKAYQKGTIHLTFNDDEILDNFNVFVGVKKRWLPNFDDKNIKREFKSYNESNIKLLT